MARHIIHKIIKYYENYTTIKKYLHYNSSTHQEADHTVFEEN